jgi:hypothetical protein
MPIAISAIFKIGYVYVVRRRQPSLQLYMFDNCETLDGNEDDCRNDQEVAGETAYQDIGLGLHDPRLVRSSVTIPRNCASRKRTVADDRLGS